jgi:hypothetical protein
MANRRLFVPNLRGVGQSSNVAGVVGAAAAAYENLPPGGKQAINDGVSRAYKYGKDRMNNNNNEPRVRPTPAPTSGGPNNGGSGGGSNNNNNNRPKYVGYALSNAPNPSSINLKTPIAVNARVSDYMDTEENKCSPLHMTCAKLMFPTNAGNALYNYWNTVVAFDLQSKAQAVVNFNLKVGTDFSTEKILTAMNDASYAAQVYYYFTSILTYHSDPANKNEGMIYLRAQMGPSHMDALALLGRRLADTPIPPNYLEFIRFCNANYYSGDNQGSAMIKLAPVPFNNATGSVTDVNVITAALASLNSNINNEVFSLIRRVVPSWRPSVLEDVPVTPVYNANFSTLFMNAPFHIQPAINANNYYPAVIDSDQTISYNSATNNLDGIIFACASVYVNQSLLGTPGLLLGIGSGTNTGNNRCSYYQVGGVKKLYATKLYPYLNYSRQDTWIPSEDLTKVYSPHIYGCDKVLGVSADTIKQSTYEAMDWLMSLDSIKKSTRSSDYNPSNRNKRMRG